MGRPLEQLVPDLNSNRFPTMAPDNQQDGDLKLIVKNIKSGTRIYIIGYK